MAAPPGSADQPMLEGMPLPLYAASPARLAGYLDCPRRYRMAYLDRPTPPRGPAWAHRSVGAAVHTALARWWGLRRPARTPAAGGALLTEAWPADGFRDAAQAMAAGRRVRAQVERYLSGVDADAVPVGVERTLRTQTRRASLWGRVDRLDDRLVEGRRELVVVDYKTGRSQPSPEDAAGSMALAVYAAAAARVLRRRCVRVELHHLPSASVTAFEHTDASLAEHLDRADAVAADLADLDARHARGPSGSRADAAFPARVAPRCAWCDFHAVCGPGSAVPRRPPWAGLED